MTNNKSKDIATFYTEISEVSLTNEVLFIRLLDEEPDESVILRHNRILQQKLSGMKFSVLIDLRDLGRVNAEKLNMLSSFVSGLRLKIALLGKQNSEFSGKGKIPVFECENAALNWLRQG
ncbi:MAG: hypothetical protein MUC87_20670 [Bacteroidia bacterium]|jgi:hypothetical protein|nr:hypothetical protein [Bacteroidia bacterium]